MSESRAPIRIAIVNDYEIVVHGLAAMLAPFTDRVAVVELETGGTPTGVADIALFDTFAGRRHALERVDEMAGDPGISKVVLYTWDIPAEFSTDIGQRKIDAVILKSATGEALVSALEMVHRGEPVDAVASGSDDQAVALTEREREVLALLGRGSSNREIARELYLSVDTVKTHVRKLFAKLGVSNRTQAALVAVERGLSLHR